MKPFTLALVILGSAAVGGTIVHLLQPKASSVPAPVAQFTAKDTPPPPEKAAPPAAPLQPAVVAEPTAPATPSSSATDTAGSDANTAFRKTIDALLDPHITAAKKHDLIQQLVKSGQLDQAMTELKQRALDNPNDPEIPTTLGEVQLNKVRALHESGADVNDLGILAMQADQSFNAALKIDPSNYEAQLVKAISQTYWPSDPTRDPQVVQTLTSLIDRQETMPSDPGFAQTYLYLGNEYQKIGQPDKAQATWQLGLQKFPNNAMLQQKLNGQ